MKRAASVIACAATIFSASVIAPQEAQAAPIGEGCVSDFWMWRGLRASERVICDGYRAADGSWERRRGFFSDEYYVPFRCGTYSCWGGYWVDELKVIEAYRVTDATVLADEPGYIESAEARIVP